MAKKARTAAQKAATKKMLLANKARRAGMHTPASSTKRAPAHGHAKPATAGMACHHCKKPIKGHPVSYHSEGKPSMHYHVHHAKHHVPEAAAHGFDVHALGVARGRDTGRSEPRDRDWDWLGNETDGVVQGTDPQDAVDFTAGMKEGAGSTFTYHVNLNERGQFYADVRDHNDRTVFEIKSGYGEDDDGESLDTVDEGTEFMNFGLSGAVRGPVNLDKLRSYLVEVGIMPHGAKLVKEA